MGKSSNNEARIRTHILLTPSPPADYSYYALSTSTVQVYDKFQCAVTFHPSYLIKSTGRTDDIPTS